MERHIEEVSSYCILSKRQMERQIEKVSSYCILVHEQDDYRYRSITIHQGHRFDSGCATCREVYRYKYIIYI